MKTNINYKIIALVPFFGFALNSCKQNPYYHKNVIIGIHSDEVLVKDVKDNSERVIIFSGHSKQSELIKRDVKYFQNGDTVRVFAMDYDGNGVFATSRIKDIPRVNLYYRTDSIRARRTREHINKFQENSR